MSALDLPFSESSKSFSVTAELYNDGKLLDTVTIDYPCLSSDCEATSYQSGERSVFGVAMLVAGGVSAVLVLVVLVSQWLRKKKISRLKRK